MEEFIGITFICVLLGASGFLWFWPVPTIVVLCTGAVGSLYWWNNFKKKNASLEFKSKLQEKIVQEPRLALVWKPNLMEQLTNGLDQLIKDLQTKDIPTEVLANLIEIKEQELPSLKNLVREKELSLQEFLYHNEIVHLATIKELNRQKLDGSDPKVVDSQIHSLEIKIKEIEEQRREYEELFLAVSELIQALQSIKAGKKMSVTRENYPQELKSIYRLLQETADILNSLNNL